MHKCSLLLITQSITDCILQGPPGSQGPIGYPGPRGVKVGVSCVSLVIVAISHWSVDISVVL